jgi:hypothetical protein
MIERGSEVAVNRQSEQLTLSRHERAANMHVDGLHVDQVIDESGVSGARFKNHA